jgi:antitoxin YefM
MDAITYTQARKNFTTVMNQVCDDHTPIIITRQSERPVVMMSLEDYNAIEETMYLLRSPKNAQRLYQAIEQLKEGKYQQHELIEEDEDNSSEVAPGATDVRKIAK